ncbi:MAG: TRAP transporter large permease [Mailhella sp.]|nr:TRAP transporter large permease [Mailhella sp.]
MSSTMIGCLGIGLLLLLIFLRVPIGVAMIVSGVVGFSAVVGLEPGLALLSAVPYETFINPAYAVVALFVLMGNFAFKSGISDDLFMAVRKWMGSLKGGLALATVAACGGFAAICGSSVACAVTMGVVALPEMAKSKYSNALSTGCIAAGGTLGILIPPSTIMIIYGIITEQSIGKLFMAGMIPGFIQMILYMLVVRLWVGKFPEAGPAAGKFTFQEKMQSLSRIWSVLLLMIVVVGGLYLGIFSPNEAGGVGAFGAFVIGLLLCRRISRKQFIKESLIDTIRTQGMCLTIMLGAMIFGYFLTVSRLPMEISDAITSVVSSPTLILVSILLIMVALGCFMDSMAIVLLTVPIFFPLIQSVGIDPIWFGILVVRVTEIGLITPPVGLNLYVIQGVSGVPMGSIFKGVTPFIICDFLHVAILMMFPILSLWLPSFM